MTSGGKPAPATGLRRVWRAFTHSVAGLTHALQDETAFRQEFWIFVVFLPVLYFMPVTPLTKLALFSSSMLVLVVELLNSAIEAIIDRISSEHHELSKRAKDLGSAAVFLTICSCVIIWLYAIVSVICRMIDRW